MVGRPMMNIGPTALQTHSHMVKQIQPATTFEAVPLDALSGC